MSNEILKDYEAAFNGLSYIFDIKKIEKETEYVLLNGEVFKIVIKKHLNRKYWLESTTENILFCNASGYKSYIQHKTKQEKQSIANSLVKIFEDRLGVKIIEKSFTADNSILLTIVDNKCLDIYDDGTIILIIKKGKVTTVYEFTEMDIEQIIDLITKSKVKSFTIKPLKWFEPYKNSNQEWSGGKNGTYMIKKTDLGYKLMYDDNLIDDLGQFNNKELAKSAADLHYAEELTEFIEEIIE